MGGTNGTGTNTAGVPYKDMLGSGIIAAPLPELPLLPLPGPIAIPAELTSNPGAACTFAWSTLPSAEYWLSVETPGVKVLLGVWLAISE